MISLENAITDFVREFRDQSHQESEIFDAIILRFRAMIDMKQKFNRDFGHLVAAPTPRENRAPTNADIVHEGLIKDLNDYSEIAKRFGPGASYNYRQHHPAHFPGDHDNHYNT